MKRSGKRVRLPALNYQSDQRLVFSPVGPAIGARIYGVAIRRQCMEEILID